jgi:hypothetical protein
MKTLTRILLILACVAAPLAAADLPLEFKQRWIAGKQYFFTTQTSQQSTISFGPQTMEQAMAMTMEMSVKVQAHEDGKRKRLTTTNDRVTMDMTMNEQKMSYDSAKPDAGTDPLGMGKTMGRMIGKELKTLTNEKDEISEIENYDEYMKAITEGGAPAGMDMSKMFSRDGLLQTMKQHSLQSFPDHPVAVGESWPFTYQLKLPQVGSVKIKGTYTYKGLVDRGGVSCAEVQTDGVLAMDLGEAEAAGGNPAVAALGMKVTNGSLKGPLWFDVKLGMVRDAELVQEMTMSMKNPADPTVEIVVPMKQKITTTLTKVADLK